MRRNLLAAAIGAANVSYMRTPPHPSHKKKKDAPRFQATSICLSPLYRYGFKLSDHIDMDTKLFHIFCFGSNFNITNRKISDKIGLF